MHKIFSIRSFALILIFPILYACSAAIPTAIEPEEDVPPIPSEEPSPQAIIKEASVEYLSMTLDSGQKLDYGLVLPANFDAQQTYPILLLLPPGGQTRDMVDAGFSFFADGAIKNGWIILSPVAPDGVLFFQGSETIIPEFLAKNCRNI